jgi:hypothetical protein
MNLRDSQHKSKMRAHLEDKVREAKLGTTSLGIIY